MTKTPVLAGLALAALLALPAALAHGNPEPREVDTRVLKDGNALSVLDYCAGNGLVEDTGGQTGVHSLPVIPACEGGHDLMDLDVREAWGPDGNGSLAPGLHVRLVFRRGVPDGELVDLVRFTSGGKPFELDLATADNEAFTSSTFTWVSPKSAAGTYESQVFAFVPYATLGLGPGDQLTGFSVLSRNGGADTDVMPGTYYFNGQYVPDEATQAEQEGGSGVPEQRDYTLAGPARLLNVSADKAVLTFAGNASHAHHAEAQVVTVRLATALESMDQNITVTVHASDGVRAELEGGLAKVGIAAPEAELRLAVTPVAGAGGTQWVYLLAQSDLGGLETLPLRVDLPAAAAGEDAHGHEDGHGHGDEEGGGEKGAPASPLPFALAALALAIALRRR